jgi:hypothetical protein
MVNTDTRNMPCPASAIQMVRHIGFRKAAITRPILLKKFLILVSINPLLLSGFQLECFFVHELIWYVENSNKDRYVKKLYSARKL